MGWMAENDFCKVVRASSFFCSSFFSFISTAAMSAMSATMGIFISSIIRLPNATTACPALKMP